MSKTKIAWTEEVWNPVVGCTKVSEGCKFCYAEKMAKRLACMGAAQKKGKFSDTPLWKKYSGLVRWDEKGGWNGEVFCDESALEIPLHWKKPRKVFVCSMSDLFHKDVPFEFIDKVMAVIALCPQHTFQILTKRPERMAEYFDQAYHTEYGTEHIGEAIEAITDEPDPLNWSVPFPNLWLGTSCENQKTYEERWMIVKDIPAAKLFISFEPLLSKIDMMLPLLKSLGQRKPDWVIIGCESKGGYIGRLGEFTFSEDWHQAAKDIVRQCDEVADIVFRNRLWAHKLRRIRAMGEIE